MAKARASAWALFGAGLAGIRETAVAANTAPASFGNRYGPWPHSSGNPFLLGLPGGADGAGGGYADPGARHEGAVGQAGNALLAILKGASPTAPHDRALRHSAREAAAAKAEIGATQALFGLYGPAARHDAARAAAELAAGLGVPLRAAGPASTGSGYPPWRFGMAQNPYLTARLSAGSDTGRYDASNPFGPGYTAPMAPPHMVREGYSRPRPELAFPTPSGRIAPDVGGGRWYDAPRAGRTRGHDGIDFEAMPGTPVLAPVDGVVTGTGKSYAPEEGKPTLYFVEITSGDGHVTRTHYVDHSVKKGDRVMAGEQIRRAARE